MYLPPKNVSLITNQYWAYYVSKAKQWSSKNNYKEAAHHFYEQSFYMLCYRRQRQMVVKIIFKILDYIFF